MEERVSQVLVVGIFLALIEESGHPVQMQHIVKIQSHYYYVPQSPNYAREKVSLGVVILTF